MKKLFLLSFLLISACASPSLHNVFEEVHDKNIQDEDVIYQKVLEALDKGADPNDNFKRQHPLTRLNFEKYPKVGALLIERGANPNSKIMTNSGTFYDTLPLIDVDIITADNNYFSVKEMLKLGADINYKDEKDVTPLMALCFLQVKDKGFDFHAKLAQELIRKGAQVNYLNSNGSSILIVAAHAANNPKFIDVLIKNGAKINYQTPKYKQTALMHAATFNDNADIIKVLIKNGADINKKDVEGRTAMDFAVANKKYDNVRALASAGAKADLREIFDDDNLSNDEELIKKLLKNGSNPNIKYPQETQISVLFTAVLHDSIDPEIVRILLEHGGDIYQKDNEGECPYDYLKGEKLKIAKEFLAKQREIKKAQQTKKLNDELKSLEADKLF